MRKSVYLPILISFIAVLVTGCVINVTPQNLIYQSPKVETLNLTNFQEKAFKDGISVAIKSIAITGVRGNKIRGVQVLYQGAKANIVLFGGNGSTINKSASKLHRLGSIPANIIWFDYPGAGISDKPADMKPEHMLQDAMAVYDYATEKLRNDKPMLIHGVDLGTAVATYVALERNPDGLVLEGAVVNLTQLIYDNSPGWSAWLTRYKLSDSLKAVDNAYQVGTYTGPLLVIVGEKDKKTPPKYSQILYQVSPSENKNLVVVEGAEHNNVLTSPIAVEAYQAFIKSL
ncbi:alpha/beta hydrolase [Alteromonas sp. AMM-1]|uniref:alpha/beta hydrolase n=1 Tax=Alteromonas sp. AMM-1 TaxID=3394233 RepID=UPI0039A69E3E